LLSRVFFRPSFARLTNSSSFSTSTSSSSSFRKWLPRVSGLVSGIGVAAFAFTTYTTSMAKEEVALDPNNFKSFKLLEVYPVTHNTNLFRFELPKRDQTLGLDVASCLVVKAPIGEGGKDEVRPYTPVSSPEDRGFLDLCIKVYPKGVMSKHIGNLKPGDTLDFKGPFSKIPYKANMKKNIGMIAGGTGITPMYQVLNEILKNPKDKTEVHLLFGNLSEPDVILKSELDKLALRHQNFHVHYVIDKATTKTWKHDVGYITDDLINKYLPGPSDDNLIMVCGPPGLMKVISGEKTKDNKQGELSGSLKKLGYNESQVFKF